MIKDLKELKEFLDIKADEYNVPDFILDDPIQIPHRFELRQDVEIAGFLTSIIAWGTRKSILGDANKMMSWMEESPYDFVLNFKDSDLEGFKDKVVHRTFNGEDFVHFLKQLQKIYKTYDTLEDLFLLHAEESNFYHSFERFRNAFFNSDFSHRSQKHISSTYKKSSAKRLMMYLRWMVRTDKRGVDFGLWDRINPAYLSIPLDVHTANVSRKLGLIQRKQNDWKTLEELDHILRQMDAEDPAKYDFALFGLGVTKEIV